MDRERRKLRELEARHFETEQQLETCSREEEELLLDRFKKQHDQLEVARKHFDDLEFQQLEVSVRTQSCWCNSTLKNGKDCFQSGFF